jgi:hypothetical protein
MGVIHIKSNTIGDMTGTVTVPTSNGATTTVAATDLVRPSDWNSNHSQLFTLSGNNTLVQSTVGGTNMIYQGAGGISLAGSTDTLVFSGPVGTLMSTVLAPFDNKVPQGQSSFSVGQGSIHIFPAHLESYVSADHVRMPCLITNSSSATASAQKGYTLNFGIYSKNATNQTVLTRHYSTSYTMAASHNSNASWMLSIITAIGNSTSYNTVSASSAGLNLSNSLHGSRELILPISSILPPGEWWWAINASTSSAGAGGAVLNISHLGVGLATYNRVGIVLNSSNSAMFGQNLAMGVYSTTTGALPAAISFTQIFNAANLPVFFLATGTV